MKEEVIKILVVDDDISSRDLLRRKISELMPAYIFEASSGNEAIKIINSHQLIDLIVSDFQMPDGNGIELYNHAIDSTPALFIFFTSEINLKIARANQKFIGCYKKNNICGLLVKLKEIFELRKSNSTSVM